MITLKFFSSLKVSMKEWLFAGAIFYLAYYSILVVYLRNEPLVVCFFVDEGMSSAQSKCFSSIISDDGFTLAI